MRPVHAGLLGEDVLYLLDEVHLSRAFHETLLAVDTLATSLRDEAQGARRFACVSMSATPGSAEGTIFSLDRADRNDATLAPRLGATKPATLRLVETPKNESKARERLAGACVREARKLLEEVSNARRMAIIVNRVDTARRIAEDAERFIDWKVHLITGRMRPLDRRDLLRKIEPLIQVGTPRGDVGKHLIVSTQAIEVGADFDFDVMVTECASLDAIRQRIGRLDRIGSFRAARVVIVVGSGQIDDGENAAEDAVYGHALARTWHWLTEAAGASGQIDMGTEAVTEQLRTIPCDRLLTLLSPRVSAPVLLPTYIDLWSETSPTPEVEPDIASFLHGPARRTADVQIVWRADIEGSWLVADTLDDVEHTITDILTACPPSPLEAMSIPIGAVRAWLRARSTGATEPTAVTAVADVEGVQEVAGESGEERGDAIAPAVLWKNERATVVTRPTQLTPGATLVVPAEYGGVSRENWDPTARSVVPDRGDEAQLLHCGRATVRWDERVVVTWNSGRRGPRIEIDPEASQRELERAAYDDWASELLTQKIPDWARIALGATMRARRRIVRIPIRCAPGISQPTWRASVALGHVPNVALRVLRQPLWESQLCGLESVTDGDVGTASGKAVALDRHLTDVRAYAESFARNLGLDEDTVRDVAIAAAMHDVGKIDPRFQLLLHEADELALAMARGPLAKSGMPSGDSAGRKRAREQSGYPMMARHELLSTALASAAPAVRDRVRDLDLVLHSDCITSRLLPAIPSTCAG